MRTPIFLRLCKLLAVDSQRFRLELFFDQFMNNVVIILILYICVIDVFARALLRSPDFLGYSGYSLSDRMATRERSATRKLKMIPFKVLLFIKNVEVAYRIYCMAQILLCLQIYHTLFLPPVHVSVLWPLSSYVCLFFFLANWDTNLDVLQRQQG